MPSIIKFQSTDSWAFTFCLSYITCFHPFPIPFVTACWKTEIFFLLFLSNYFAPIIRFSDASALYLLRTLPSIFFYSISNYSLKKKSLPQTFPISFDDSIIQIYLQLFSFQPRSILHLATSLSLANSPTIQANLAFIPTVNRGH